MHCRGCRSTAFLEYVSSEFTSPQHLPLLSVAESDTSVHAEMRVQSIGGEVMEGGNGESAAVKTVQSCLIHHSGVVRGRAIEYLSEVSAALGIFGRTGPYRVSSLDRWKLQTTARASLYKQHC